MGRHRGKKNKTAVSIQGRAVKTSRPFVFWDKAQAAVYKLVEDLGFLEVFQGPNGYVKIEHPDLTIEFLVPERGKGSDRPYNVRQLKVNAQPLRHLDFLVKNVIPLHCNNLVINVPHPAAYALHKFIIFKRRTNKDKQERDIEGAF